MQWLQISQLCAMLCLLLAAMCSETKRCYCEDCILTSILTCCDSCRKCWSTSRRSGSL
uniref:CKB21 n=1 Tax=Arundo donax TaxID=35708 RepID=A0A0A9DIS5_ARUDO